MNFETYRKRGRNWEYLGIRTGVENSRSAALQTSYVHNLKVVGIRPEDSKDKILVYRFKYVASLAAG